MSDNFNNAEAIVEAKIAKEGLTEFNKVSTQNTLIDYQKALKDSVAANRYQIDQSVIKDSLSNRSVELFESAKSQEIASFKLENSYIGYMGKAITPIVEPLGYDWKIGIAVLTSFAAREVFVGTLATIYSVGSDEQDTITNRMAAEINPKTQKPLFNLASGISLLLFYAFAMQCASTLAIVKRETNSWKWPMGQLVIMSAFAYIVALIAYQTLK
jgi:ferrous iron transport protein B